jgi:hypothetical protein
LGRFRVEELRFLVEIDPEGAIVQKMIVELVHQDSPSPQTKTTRNVLSCLDISGNRFYFSAGVLPIAF